MSEYLSTGSPYVSGQYLKLFGSDITLTDGTVVRGIKLPAYEIAFDGVKIQVEGQLLHVPTSGEFPPQKISIDGEFWETAPWKRDSDGWSSCTLLLYVAPND